MNLSDPCQILIIDSDNVSSRVAQAMLQKLGCDVQIAENGEDALSLCRKLQFHLILIDWSLDGASLTRKIRALPYGYVVPIIGTSNHHTRLECLEAGANGVLGKPFEIRKLAKLLEEWGCQAVL